MLGWELIYMSDAFVKAVESKKLICSRTYQTCYYSSASTPAPS